MINRQEYAWEDIEVVIAGNLVTGIQAISYTSRKTHENVYGRGAKPIAITRGKEEFEGSITLLQSEVEALQQSINEAGKNITNIPPFNISVAYTPNGEGDLVIDSLIGCRFSEITKSHGTEEMNMVVELPLVIFDIQYNSGS